MIQQVINTIITFLISGILGYCVSVIKNYQKKTTSTNNALKIILQNNLTNAYFVYNIDKKIPDYVYKNWLDMLKEYKALGGNDFVDTLAHKMESWEIMHTDIIK